MTTGLINRLFLKLQARYGNQWVNQWDDERLLKVVKNEWYEELKALSVDDLKRGLDTYRGDFPPNLMQFSKACRVIKKILPPCHKEYVGELLPAPTNKKIGTEALLKIRKML